MPTPMRSEIEQRADHETEIDGVRPGRFVGFGDEGLTFDGEEPGPDEAKDAEEQAVQRTDEWDESLHPRGEHGMFGHAIGGGPAEAKGKGGAKGGGGKFPGLGLAHGNDRFAMELQKSIATMKEAHAQAAKAIEEAKWHLENGRAGGYMDAKRALSDPFNALQKSVEQARITQATRGETLSRLPKYGDPTDPHNKAHALVAEHAALIEKTAAMKSDLGRATYGDKEQVSKAVDDYRAKHDPAAAADRLVHEMAERPFGFSWRPDTGHATTGIMVAEHPDSGSSTTLDAKTLSKESEIHAAVRDYVEKHFDKVMADPSLHFGGWKSTDAETGLPKFYLDLSKRWPKEQKEAAVASGVRHNQRAVWDIDNSAEIDTGGTGEKS